MEWFLRLMWAFIGLLGPAALSAQITLELVPDAGVVQVGEQVSLEVSLSDFRDSGAEAIGAFDLLFRFDDNLWQAASVSFGSALGSESQLEALNGSRSEPGLAFFQVSLLPSAQLQASQGADLELATITLVSKAVGQDFLELIPVDVVSGSGVEVTVAAAGLPMEIEDGTGPCAGVPDSLCLRGDRFQVEVDWRAPDGTSGTGQVVSAGSEESGLFWFFEADNWEMLVKVLDGCAVNQRFWVLAAGATNVEYVLRVTDSVTGSTAEYENPQGNSPGTIADTSAFDACGGGQSAVHRLLDLGPAVGDPPSISEDQVAVGPACVPSASRMCLQQGRFQVEVEWQDFEQMGGSGVRAPDGSDSTGLFWFFNPDNWEMLVKVLDGCQINGRFWVLAHSATNVEYRLKVLDTLTGETREYFNPLGNLNNAVLDTEGFGNCS